MLEVLNAPYDNESPRDRRIAAPQIRDKVRNDCKIHDAGDQLQ